MARWIETTIGSVAEVYDGPHATPKTIDNGPIFLGITALNNGRIDLTQTRHVTDEDFAIWTRRVKPQAGDVVFSYETKIGEAAIIPDGLKCCLGRRMGLVRANIEKLDPRFFLYYYLAPEFQEFLRSRTISGATVDRIALKDFPYFQIAIPPFPEQRAIAAVLGALDDKIDLNRRMNETLERQARAIFRDWFVDFGPTRAKQEKREPYLAPEIWSLFPDRLDDEGKPEGWKRTTLGNLEETSGGEIRTGPFGSQLHQSDYVPAGTPVVMPANLTLGAIIEDGIARIDAETRARLSDHQLRAGDVIYGRRGDIGRKALIGPDEEGWLCGTGCLRVRIISAQCPPLFLFYHLDQPEIREWIATRAVGATMPNLNTSILREVEILLPDDRLCGEFVELCKPLDDRGRVARSENKHLGSLRDLLLPKLMSGEIRVRDAEKIIEDAA
jgi:type I restriction enzyme S subunit